WICVRDSFRRIHRTHRHLLCSASCGDKPDTNLDLSHVGFCSGARFVAMHRYLAAAAERQSVGGRYDWLCRIPQPHYCSLKSRHHEVDVVPFFFLSRKQEHHDICTRGKITALISDNEALEIILDLVDRKIHHRYRIAADRIHLRVKFKTSDTVANVDQRSSWISLDNARSLFDRLKN